MRRLMKCKKKIQHSTAEHTFDTIYIHYPLSTDGFNEGKTGGGGIEVPQQIFASAFFLLHSLIICLMHSSECIKLPSITHAHISHFPSIKAFNISCQQKKSKKK